jgi:fructose-bisphosphate aldolase, class I
MEKLTPFKEELIATARAICRPGFGILAADESTGTIGARFSKINVENVEENRRKYRELLFTTPGMEEHISGVIMFEETLYQSTADGKPFVDVLKEKNVIPGIKVDAGIVIISGTHDETATQGLDKLGDRCKKYYEQGARFAKWRAVLKIDTKLNCPSECAIAENAHGLARYASICQENGLVPIVEPEILCDGTHTIEECADASERVFAAVVKELHDQGVLLEGALLKPNMITPGMECETKATPAEVAFYTVRTLSRTIPAALPGIMFLSGGQSEEDASIQLSAMNKLEGVPKPWSLSFSFGRALQASCLKAWLGKDENIEAAQKAFLGRAVANGQATLGKYEGGSGDTEDLHVKKYVY